MTRIEKRITRLLRMRWLTVLVVLAAIASAWSDCSGPLSGWGSPSHSVLFASPAEWISNPGLSRWVAIAANITAIFLLVFLNVKFNLLRTTANTFVALYAVMQCASPLLMHQFAGGVLLADVVLWGVAMIFSLYGVPGDTRQVFLLFAVLSALTLCQVGFIPYMALFLVGCVLMRIFTPRVVVAAILGCVTPLWLLFGFGITGWDDFHQLNIENPFENHSALQITQVAFTVGFTFLAGTVLGGLNLLKLLAKNARTRAYNGFVTAIGVISGIMAVVDFTNIAFYIPVLNAAVAIQAGHFFKLYTKQRSYIVILLLLIVYISIRVWIQAD